MQEPGKPVALGELVEAAEVGPELGVRLVQLPAHAEILGPLAGKGKNHVGLDFGPVDSRPVFDGGLQLLLDLADRRPGQAHTMHVVPSPGCGCVGELRERNVGCLLDVLEEPLEVRLEGLAHVA